MRMTAAALTTSRQTVYEKVEQPSSDLRLAPKSCDPAPMIAEKIVLVCFPVLLPGENGRVIPFGRYDLTASHHNGSPGTTSEKAVLVNRDNGACIVLSAQELTAIVEDPDVEII